MNCKEVFGRQFHKAREELNLSQQQVADVLGVNRSLISSWENAKASPLLERLDEISAALRKPITYFFGGAQNEASYGFDPEELSYLAREAAARIPKVREQVARLGVTLGFVEDALGLLASTVAPGDLPEDQQILEAEREVKGLRVGPDTHQQSARDFRIALSGRFLAASLHRLAQHVDGANVERAPLADITNAAAGQSHLAGFFADYRHLYRQAEYARMMAELIELPFSPDPNSESNKKMTEIRARYPWFQEFEAEMAAKEKEGEK